MGTDTWQKCGISAVTNVEYWYLVQCYLIVLNITDNIFHSTWTLLLSHNSYPLYCTLNNFPLLVHVSQKTLLLGIHFAEILVVEIQFVLICTDYSYWIFTNSVEFHFTSIIVSPGMLIGTKILKVKMVITNLRSSLKWPIKRSF